MNHKSNFYFLEKDSPKLAEIMSWAEVYLKEDPNTSLLKTGQFTELLAQIIAKKGKIKLIKNEEQYELLKRLKNANLIDEDINNLFHDIRKVRNDAAHNLDGDYETALVQVKYAHKLAIWYYKKFINPYFVHTTHFIIPSTSIFAIISSELFSHYREVLNKLQEEVNNLNELKIKQRNFPTDRLKNEKKKEALKLSIIEKKRQAEIKQSQVLKEQKAKRSNLVQQISRLDLELMRVEIEISELKGFESHSEIMSLLREQYQRKEAIEQQKNQLNYSLNHIEPSKEKSIYCSNQKKRNTVFID